MLALEKHQSFETIDQYFSSHTEESRTGLEKIRQVIKKAAPGAEEVISYQMPAFKFHGMLIWCAAYKNHYGLYPGSKVIAHFKDKLAKYKCSKGTIQFPLDEPIPVKLISEIVRCRIKENLEKEEIKQMTKANRTTNTKDKFMKNTK